MKRSRFIAVLLICLFTFGSINTAFAMTDTVIKKDTTERRDTIKAGSDVFITTLAGAAMSESALTAVGSGIATGILSATGVTVSPVLVGAVIVAGTAATACYAVNCFIDWIW